MVPKLLPELLPLWQQLLKGERLQRTPHAILLSGKFDAELVKLAEQFAAKRLCHHPEATEACQACPSCKLLRANNHPDLYTIVPEKSDHSIKIDPIRRLLSELQQTAHQQSARIIILSPVEALTESAANALLKTLEEPGKNVLFLLITHALWRIPVTLRSRCQVMHAHVPTGKVSKLWLLDPWCQNFIRCWQGSLCPVALAGLASKENTQKLLDILVNLLASLIRLRLGSEKGTGSAVSAIVHSEIEKELATLSQLTAKNTWPELFEIYDAVLHARFLEQEHTGLNMTLFWSGILIRIAKFSRNN